MTTGRPKEDLYEKYVRGKEEIIKADLRNGATVENLCLRLGCSKTTFKNIRKRFPVFLDLLKEGREIADMKVESALFKRALGYDYEETTTEVIVDTDGSSVKTTFVKKTKKHISPDTGACMAWLKNRKPNVWKDKHDVEVTSPNLIIEVRDSDSKKELEKLKEKLS